MPARRSTTDAERAAENRRPRAASGRRAAPRRDAPASRGSEATPRRSEATPRRSEATPRRSEPERSKPAPRRSKAAPRHSEGEPALETYRRKRNFERTPEPRGGTRRRAETALQFVVQKHRARRLHYDFRLELDGVLKSWAIPKGPSLDPRERRLAVETEDHPLEYAGFEGVIPKGEYGGGAVLVWDRGFWEPEGDPVRGLEKGKLDFGLHGYKLRGRWTLVRLAKRAGERPGKDNWLLIKRRDHEAGAGEAAEIVEVRPESVLTGRSLSTVASQADRVWHSNGGEENAAAVPAPGRPDSVAGARRAPLPRKPAAAIPTPADTVPTDPGWFHEPALNGARLLCRIDAGKATLIPAAAGGAAIANDTAITTAAVELPCRRALLDGVAAVFDARGVSLSSPSAADSDGASAAGQQFAYVVFDLLYLDGWDLRRSPLRARKELLRLLLARPPEPLRYNDHVEGHGQDFYLEACRLGLRGVVSKAADGPYRAGSDADWRLVLCRGTTRVKGL